MNGEENLQQTEDFSQEQYLLLLWTLMMDSPIKEWNEFAHDLVYNNRFSSTHKVLEVIKNYSGERTQIIKKGHVFFEQEYTIRIHYEILFLIHIRKQPQGNI